MAAELGKLECSDMSCSQANLLRGVIGYGSDPAQITSPVKRTPLPEVPADDGFHRTFQPFDMLKSPTSLGGHSFQDLNAHLAQNARLSTRQRSLRHALRTATKEYVIPEEPALPGIAVYTEKVLHVQLRITDALQTMQYLLWPVHRFSYCLCPIGSPLLHLPNRNQSPKFGNGCTSRVLGSGLFCYSPSC